MPIEITEVVRRAAQGRTAPYICRADDEQTYFVKNRALPRRELVAEWLSAALAEAVGLPLPPCSIAQVPHELVQPAMGAWLADLGAGPAFASQAVLAGEIGWQQAGEVEPELQALVAAFDWWIQNMDRTLSALGGNPNLLWRRTGENEGLVVIDHNLAFDPVFDAEVFMQTHVFADGLRRLASDYIDREAVRQRFLGAMRVVPTACATIPEEWRFVDPEMTVAATWNEADFQRVLNRCLDEQGFWKLQP